jgi:hypothetical protein
LQKYITAIEQLIENYEKIIRPGWYTARRHRMGGSEELVADLMEAAQSMAACMQDLEVWSRLAVKFLTKIKETMLESDQAATHPGMRVIRTKKSMAKGKTAAAVARAADDIDVLMGLVRGIAIPSSEDDDLPF